MFELAQQPGDVGRVIDGGIRLFKDSIRSVFLLSLSAAFIIYAPELILKIVFWPIDEEATPDAVTGGLVIALMLLMAVFYFAFYSALILKVWHYARRDSIETMDLIQRGFSLLLPVIAASIVYAIAIMVGILLLIIPGIYFSVALSLYYYLILIEGLGPISGLKRSFNLIKGHWWRTVLILFIPTIIVMVIFTVIGIVSSIVAFILSGFNEESLTFVIVMDIFGCLAQSVAIPFFICLILVLYQDLKLRLDGQSPPPVEFQDPIIERKPR